MVLYVSHSMHLLHQRSTPLILCPPPPAAHTHTPAFQVRPATPPPSSYQANPPPPPPTPPPPPPPTAPNLHVKIHLLYHQQFLFVNSTMNLHNCSRIMSTYCSVLLDWTTCSSSLATILTADLGGNAHLGYPSNQPAGPAASQTAS